MLCRNRSWHPAAGVTGFVGEGEIADMAVMGEGCRHYFEMDRAADRCEKRWSGLMKPTIVEEGPIGMLV